MKHRSLHVAIIQTDLDDVTENVPIETNTILFVSVLLLGWHTDWYLDAISTNWTKTISKARWLDKRKGHYVVSEKKFKLRILL